MAAPTTTVRSPAPRRASATGIRADVLAAGLALALVAAASAAIVLVHWYTEEKVFAFAPPLYARWLPHVGWGTPLAVLIAGLVVLRGPELAARWSWRRLCLAGYLTTVAWSLALALVGGWTNGVVTPMSSPYQYLVDVPRVTSIPAMLRDFTTHVLSGQPGSWAIQVSGHPPGALLVFVLLDRIGLGGPVPAALLCVLVGGLTAVAVPSTLRVLGTADQSGAARAVLPFAVLLPGAIWRGPSADGLFAGAMAVAVLLVAVAARRRFGAGGVLAGLAGGVLLGGGLFLSYGLVLMAPIALAACWVARSWRAVLLAGLGAVVVVAAFAAAGFWWWDGYLLVVHRYYQDVGLTRPYNYWVWADLACLVLCAGPAVVPGLRRVVVDGFRGFRGGSSPSARPVVALALGAAVAIAVADKSGLSKAEVERIWLPFAVWLTTAVALLPAPTRRWWLLVQALTALVVSHLVVTIW
jgi:hypothetical protein